jgi:hypothetical protein
MSRMAGKTAYDAAALATGSMVKWMLGMPLVTQRLGKISRIGPAMLYQRRPTPAPFGLPRPSH